MGVNYYLQKNLLSSKPNAHAAHIISKGSLYEDDLIERMASRGTSLSVGELKGFMSLLNETISDELSRGFSVKLPFATLKLSVTGYFNGPGDTFDPSRHTVKAAIRTGPRLKQIVSSILPGKITKPVSIPIPMDYFDIRTNTQNSILSPKGMGSILGAELRFRFENAEQGVFFISEDGSLVYKATETMKPTNQRLLFSVPDLPPGVRWKLEVRIAYGRGGSIIRTGILPHLLHTE